MLSPTTYDNTGNITADTKFRGLTYAYDANSRQISASNGTWTETQVYDCAGQRVQTIANSVTRTMVYDIFGQGIADYSGSSGGTLERENIYRSGQLLATYEAGASALKYALTDIQGSTRAIMNNGGASSVIIARHDYLPFGEEVASGIGLRTSGQGFGATDTNRQKYGLTQRDDATGLDHTWFRKYENSAGRFTSPDPLSGAIGDPQSFNHYAYVTNDPVNLTDSMGLSEDPGPAPKCEDGTDPRLDAEGHWQCTGAGVTHVTVPILPDPISWDDLPGAGGHGTSITMRLPQNPLPSDLRRQVQNTASNCADYMNRLLNQLGSKYTAETFGDLFDRVGMDRIAIDHNEFVRVGKPTAAGLAEDNPRRIFINTGVTAIPRVTTFELLHQARGSGMFDDPDLDKAVIKLMTPEKQAQARLEMKGTKGKPYQPSTIAHRELNNNCFNVRRQ